ncbi:hypothetical protein PHYBLDRAFT_138813 [Phycomyces blakesleeanus NRRL 1555(-)]|uniref:CxC5 like cysteine cluster associated with KDZ domain-containing protein n=1 Tax=Phycomyces blakesleeanus (strain ATCC 8743b / DSM 1359 / FGSC 10004 / NBRC 33097 / NRRL 1555) TaxID=763407 RepID=A0A162VAG7_PHYB8|nr:hypothetical protein PHYBLDRAFT_138813 [Phycomyces blakesleeanus NRRL 1555(-)]OAD81263.1 hypothetical protein PHYBLDRAFT_138813 [Phycomyces blakesleeanus NRRL 1555(-)]|eukprot:XP_018299303.1 hypothetical protein PHYBLDRAFT_138813 [Phycomyces blakesleeanus NRRL 1555(-)]
MEIDFEDNVDAKDQVEAEDLFLFDINSVFDSKSKDESVIEATILDISYNESDDVRDHFSSSNMPVDPTHAFIASFAAFFISKYVVKSGSAVLLKFHNEVLAYFEQSFRLSLSINGVNSMTGLSDMTRGVQQFVACGNCNKVYKESNVVPECCNFERLSGRKCGNTLFFATSRALIISKKIYMYNSIIKTLSILFCRLAFKDTINHWRTRVQVPDIMFDIYNSAKWNSLPGTDLDRNKGRENRQRNIDRFLYVVNEY